MFGRHPEARGVLDGKDKHADTVKQLQFVAICLLNFGQGLSKRARHIREDEDDEYPIEYARRQVPAAAVLEDIERPLPRCREALLHVAHVALTPRPFLQGPQRMLFWGSLADAWPFGSY